MPWFGACEGRLLREQLVCVRMCVCVCVCVATCRLPVDWMVEKPVRTVGFSTCHVSILAVDGVEEELGVVLMWWCQLTEWWKNLSELWVFPHVMLPSLQPTVWKKLGVVQMWWCVMFRSSSWVASLSESFNDYKWSGGSIQQGGLADAVSSWHWQVLNSVVVVAYIGSLYLSLKPKSKTLV